MTKSTITKEQVIALIAEHSYDSALVDALEYLADAMDREPVAYMHHSGQVITREECCDDKTFAICCKVETPLYRHAQPAVDSEPVGYFRRYDPDFDALITQCNKGAQDSFPLYLHAQSAKGFESAGWQFKSVNGDWLGLIDEHGKNQAVREGCEVREVFAMADGVNDRDQVRREHAEWTQTTFGNVGPIGPLKHLSKEALEAAAEPGDLSEWADMQFLLWDAQRRAGITDEQITQAMIEKLTVNKQREWPEPKDGEPRLHIKELPAPVVMDDIKLRELFDSWFASDCSFDRSPEASEEDNIAWRESYWYVWQRCRAAMLQAEPVMTANKLGNSPVIPDGYVMVPKEMTDEIGEAIAMQANCCGGIALDIYDAMLASAPHDTPALNSLQSIDSVADTWIPVSEQMPPSRHEVLVGRWWGEKPRWCCKWATYIPGPPDAQSSGWLIPGASWTPTHWMPLPAAPQGVKDE